jgi:hypothetical protein
MSESRHTGEVALPTTRAWSPSGDLYIAVTDFGKGMQ